MRLVIHGCESPHGFGGPFCEETHLDSIVHLTIGPPLSGWGKGIILPT